MKSDNVAINELLREGESWQALRLNYLPAEVANIA
jgi:hypothetical protein